MTSPVPHAPAVWFSSITSSFGLPFLLAPFRALLKGQAGDVGDRFPQSVANPSHFSSPYGNFNPLLIGALPQLLIRGLLRPLHLVWLFFSFYHVYKRFNCEMKSNGRVIK